MYKSFYILPYIMYIIYNKNSRAFRRTKKIFHSSVFSDGKINIIMHSENINKFPQCTPTLQKHWEGWGGGRRGA